MKMRDWFNPNNPHQITEDEWTSAALEAKAKLPDGCYLKAVPIGSSRMVDVATMELAHDHNGRPTEHVLAVGVGKTLEEAVIKAVDMGLPVWQQQIEYKAKKTS